MQPRFDDLTWTRPRNFGQVLYQVASHIKLKIWAKFQVLIFVGKISALNWVIWEGSDTWTEADF